MGDLRVKKVTTSGGSTLVEEMDVEATVVACMATGTYTGDGTTSQPITGMGFAPKYVKIWPKKTVDLSNIQISETTAEIMDDNASGGAIVHKTTGGHEFHTNKIISLDSDGFTVDDDGSDEAPNKSGSDYNYLAIG